MNRPVTGDLLRAIPSVDRILRELGTTQLPRPVVLAVIRRELTSMRSEAVTGDIATIVMERVRAALGDLSRSRIQPVINGTGIIIHTNFGRSPVGARVAEKIGQIATRYNNLEFDLNTGERGNRGAYVEFNLAVLCGAERATVVNNCAAALVLILRHFAIEPPRNQVIISRGELIQIGGGFRIPEILEASGARLKEIGTTNKTSLEDYREAIDANTAMILRVHRSNFYMAGFVDSPSTQLLAKLAGEHQIPLVEDLGSGATFATESIGNEHERTPAESMNDGADLTCFSGDKLLGGPQAGIIAGKAVYVEALKKNPFFRALRCDKLILAALQETVDLLLAEQKEEIPIRAMMQPTLDSLQKRAEAIVAAVGKDAVRTDWITSVAQVGGGSLPQTTIPSIALQLELAGRSAEELGELLRRNDPPIVGYIAGGRLHLDLAAIFPDEDRLVILALRAIVAG